MCEGSMNVVSFGHNGRRGYDIDMEVRRPRLLRTPCSHRIDLDSLRRDCRWSEKGIYE